MKKTLLSIVTLFSMVALSFGQTPLPNDPEVKTGKLDNGMTYYIRHNALPEGRAEFYLATHVGAIQETPDQDGLAHFLEHMCFNGLKNLPGKQMLGYLQHIGAEFGRNINASTGVEVTQYMLNNMPVTREGILDTCLLVMHDYSHFVLNDPEEIDAERGVILEEKRTRNTAGWRMFEKSAPYLYGESSKYAHCNIIGSEENLKTFQPSSLHTFYKTWYQPDMQAIIVVGDIDVDQVYEKIVKCFSDIPAPAQPTVKHMPEVEFNEEPVVGIITDPENTSTSVEFIWKLGAPTPNEINGTDMGYFERLIKRIVSGVMDERFGDITAKADAPFFYASLGIGNLCETCEVVDGSLECENAKTLDAVKAFYTEYEKLKRYGVTDDEIGRVKDNVIKALKDKVAGESTRKNPEFIRPIINNFFHGYSYLAPGTELQIAETIFAQINADMVNQLLPQVLTDNHLTVVYVGVDQPGHVHPTEKDILDAIEEVKNSEIKANAVAAVSSDLMAGMKIKAGKAKKVEEGTYGSKIYTLKNGLKVVVLPTEYKKDQVIFNLVKKGGNSLIPTDDLASFDRNIVQLFISNCGIAGFSKTTLSKMLAGKSVRVTPYINAAYNGFQGSCTPDDIETALQLLNLYFTNPRFDPEEWNVGISQLQAYLPNMVSTPDYAFSEHLYGTLFNNARAEQISMKKLEKASLDTYAKYYRMLASDVAGATLYIVGNVNPDTLIPMVETYCGSLNKGRRLPEWNNDNIVSPVKGEVSDIFNTKMTTPKVTVCQIYSADIPYSLQKEVNLDAANFILDMIYVETLREEEGGTYGASALIGLDFEPKESAMIQVYFETNTEQQERLRDLAVKGLKDLAADGPTEEQLTRAIENAKKNIPEKRITNNWWMNALQRNDKLGGDYNAEYEAAVNNITAQGIKDALNEILAQNNICEIVMLPEE